MKNFIKKNIKMILAIFITAIICITGSVYATIRIQASEISYDTTSVADALDSMYLTMFSNNYSLDEKVVGKWIDGRNVYQQTLVGDNVPANGAILISDVDNVLNATGMTYWSNPSDPAWYQFPFDTSGNVIRWRIINNNISLLRNAGTYNTKYVWTFVYTKASELN